MKKISLFIVMIMLSASAFSQGCEGMFPMKQGTVIETQSFNPKGKLQGTSRQTILSVENIDNGVALKVRGEQMDNKGNPEFEQDLNMRCVDDVFYMDMKDMMDPKTLSGFKDMEVSFSGIDLEFPAKMQVGETLPDGNIDISISSSGFSVMNMKVNTVNRKVEAYEPVTTPAGTFDCYKITYDMEIKTIINVKTKGAQWVANKTGVVKSEQYDKKGNLSGYTLLSKFEN